MVLGTGSHVGKSLITTALCRIFAQEGYRVTPFKAQNMSLNSAATVEGLEMGRAQALQAEAAGVAASVHMNPILLKPSRGGSSQVVVHGKIWGQLTASEYHQRRVRELLPAVEKSYGKLARENDVVLIEGAGSPAEINLKQHDIVNMRMAELADAACLLVGDIDRGGVFASLLGTVMLLEPAEQARIRGFLINKFRGDQALLQPGIETMETRLKMPCLGVVPHLAGLLLEEEDSMALPELLGVERTWQRSNDRSRRLRIAVLALPSFSNFTDFDAIRCEPSISLFFCRDAMHLADSDVVILPGSKQTADDLRWMRGSGLADALLAYATNGLVVGICGGMQMLGEEITDPSHVEDGSTISGLSLLPLRTEMQPTKTTRIAKGKTVTASLFGQSLPGLRLSGYEIHVGETRLSGGTSLFAKLTCPSEGPAEILDGCVSADSRIFGTYLHGLFDEDEFRHGFIAAARAFHGLEAAPILDDWKGKREESFNALADAVRAAVDMKELFAWVGLTSPGVAATGSGRG